MQTANNGVAIIGGMVVPAAEVKVLKVLSTFRNPATVPEISKAMPSDSKAVSDASLYSLLGRLYEKRRLVAREVVEVDVHGTKLRRVTWQAHQAARHFFEMGTNLEFPKQRAQ